MCVILYEKDSQKRDETVIKDILFTHTDTYTRTQYEYKKV